MIFNVPLHIEPLDADGFHIFISAEINTKPAKLLVDTGASKTVLDLNRIGTFVKNPKKSFETFDKRTTGIGTRSMESLFTVINEICISELRIENYQAVLINMKHINLSYRSLGLPAIDGVIGSDILMKYKAVIDYDKRIMKLKI
jgi:predicted aspartyl protease